jgi:hypothetical protein
MRRPEQRLGDDDAVAVERHGGAAMELVAQFKSLAHAPAEGIIIRPGQDSIGRQALRRWGRHRGMISRASTANCRNRRASLPGLTWASARAPVQRREPLRSQGLPHAAAMHHEQGRRHADHVIAIVAKHLFGGGVRGESSLGGSSRPPFGALATDCAGRAGARRRARLAAGGRPSQQSRRDHPMRSRCWRSRGAAVSSS